MSRAWQPPAGWRRLSTIDAHTAGEPLRVIAGGLPPIEGDTMLARRRFAEQHLDDVRRALMLEPRGHADMYGCMVTEPVCPEADLGVLFLHNQGFSTMCGHGIIALATVAVETGMVAAEEPETAIGIDTPAGLVRARVRVEGGRARAVAFCNVPSFVVELDAAVSVPGLGTVRYDLAFGGAFYAYVDAARIGVGLGPEDAATLIAHGRAIKSAIAAARPIVHPFEDDLGFLYGVIFVGPLPAQAAAGGADGVHSRNVCIFADGEVDRSPTGTGLSGRLAIHHARGDLAVDEPIVVESILGTRFRGRVVDTLRHGPHDAIVPEVEGRAFLTGRHQFLIDPEDPLGDGFLLR